MKFKSTLGSVFVFACAIGCGSGSGSGSGENRNVDHELPVTLDHKTSGAYAATVTQNGATTALNDDYDLFYNLDSAGNLEGRHNFFGIQSGAKRVSGRIDGNTVTFHSVACAGDTFSATFNRATGNGNFSGTVCGVGFTGGTYNSMSQQY